MNRKQKVTQIFSKTNSIRKITKNHYVVESQNSDNTRLGHNDLQK
jgi:hypothetical protein